MADEQRPDRRLTPVQRRRLQARLTPEERQRLNDERRNLRKRLKRAQEARERESRQATSHQAAERVREAVALHRLAQEQKQADARRQAEQEHRALQRYASSAFRNASRWKLKAVLPEVLAYFHKGQWLEPAPLATTLQPLTPEDAESMRAWSHAITVPRADILLSLFLRAREEQRREYDEREQVRLDRWTARKEALAKEPPRVRRLNRQRPFRPRRFTPTRVERLVAAALDGAVRGSQHDPFERSRGRLVLSESVWDLTAACTLLTSLASVLERQTHAHGRVDLATELAEYRWRVEDYLAAVHAGEVTLVAPRTPEEDLTDWGLDAESLASLLSDDSRAERQRHLEEEAQRHEARMRSYVDVVSRLDEERLDPDEVARLHRNLLREGASPAERRAQRAQRLHERRGRAGEVLDSGSTSSEAERLQQRLQALLSDQGHPDIIWND